MIKCQAEHFRDLLANLLLVLNILQHQYWSTFTILTTDWIPWVDQNCSSNQIMILPLKKSCTPQYCVLKWNRQKEKDRKLFGNFGNKRGKLLRGKMFTGAGIKKNSRHSGKSPWILALFPLVLCCFIALAIVMTFANCERLTRKMWLSLYPRLFLFLPFFLFSEFELSRKKNKLKTSFFPKDNFWAKYFFDGLFFGDNTIFGWKIYVFLNLIPTISTFSI